MRRRQHQLIIALGLPTLAVAGVESVRATPGEPKCQPLQVSELLASDGEAQDRFGFSVSISGNVAVVATPNADDFTGAAYTYRWHPQQGQWIQEQKLVPVDTEVGDNFGRSVSIDDDRIICGANGDEDNGAHSGSAYVFVFDAEKGVWRQEQKLIPIDGDEGHLFGSSVAILGDVAVVGAPFDDENGSFSGSAYVFRMDTDTSKWVQQQKIYPEDPAEFQAFGLIGDLTSDVILFGAPGDTDNGDFAGAAYFFRFDPETSLWMQEQKVVASDGGTFHLFGNSVSMHRDRAVIAGGVADVDDPIGGEAYIFSFDHDRRVWFEEQILIAPDAPPGHGFASAVAIGEGVIVAGSSSDADNGEKAGSIYLFRLDVQTGIWVDERELFASDGAPEDALGVSVSIDGNRVIVGAIFHDHPFQDSGAGYIFELNCPITCPWDLDDSGMVGVSDLLSLLASWGSCENCPTDFDGDGTVGDTDLAALLANWGPCP